MDCKCGCGEPVKRGRTFVDKEHQLTWMEAGGAREMGALQSLEGKQLGGAVAGRDAALSGRLAEAAAKGAERSREGGVPLSLVPSPCGQQRQSLTGCGCSGSQSTFALLTGWISTGTIRRIHH